MHRIAFVISLGLHATALDWSRQIQAVEQFLNQTRSTILESSIPHIDADEFAAKAALGESEEFLREAGIAKLTGMMQGWMDPSRWHLEGFLKQYGKYEVQVQSRREEHLHYDASVLQTVREYLKSKAKLSKTATAYNLPLEAELVRGSDRPLPAPLQDFDRRAVIQLGKTGTGTHFHKHEETWLALLQGRKAWWIAEETPSAEVAKEAKWYTSHPCSWLSRKPPEGLTFCVQHPGEIMYFSDDRFHATCNLDDMVLAFGAQGRVPEDWDEYHRALNRRQLGKVLELAASGQRLFEPMQHADGTMQEKMTPLSLAALRDWPELATYLIEQGADVQAASAEHASQPLHAAAAAGHLSMAKFLVGKGASVNAVTTDQDHPLLMAIDSGSEALIEYLLDRKADVRYAGGRSTALHLAVKHGLVSIVDRILSMKAMPVDQADRKGMQPVHTATISGHKEVLQLLLHFRANPSAADGQGMPAMHLAALFGQHGLIETLVSSRIDVNARTQQGDQALHSAAENGHVAAVRALLKMRAKVSGKFGQDGRGTPLFVASGFGHAPVVKFLIKHGAQVDPRDVELVAPDGPRPSEKIHKLLNEAARKQPSNDEL
eukprot:TRINITY_DN32835_c0_g1_i1.p1 TRINITY_DN32835_c0_g1~~TRINITY_DN32835_c0_g1_i1.p1  ORF type:complete len:603 (-),score=118.05 TRINITY_DN32835_c0_g1_i1:31-1839(-)